MNTLLLVEKAARPLKVLWADDDPDDLAGERRHLRRRGHSVETSEDFESTAACLIKHEFDVLILDQRMPWQGRTAINAGSSLLLQLRDGGLGDLNRNIPFLFVTASPDWVDDCEVPIRDLPECLGVAEKGDNVVDSLDEWLDQVEPRVTRVDPADPAEDYGEYQGSFQPPDDDGGQASERREILVEDWAGSVIDVNSETFLARLARLDDTVPEHEATLPHEFVSEANRPLIEEGATFTWTIRIEEDAAAERFTVSQLRFDEQPAITQAEIDEAMREATQAREAREAQQRREEAGA
jgi:CheY-like chemotaxis protein